MPPLLAIGLGTVCVIAAVLLFMTGHTVPAVVALVVGMGFDLLFAKALADARKAKAAATAKGGAAGRVPSGGRARGPIRGGE